MRSAIGIAICLLVPSLCLGQANERDKKVQNDRKTFLGSKDWIYNDIDAGIRASRASGKPILVVFRCIPCEACHDFDEDVASRDPIIRDLLDLFVCVRVVYGNSIDLNRFRYDFDLSFAAILMNADGTIYGRFGTRSERKEDEDLSLEGLRKALAMALKMHREIDKYRSLLAGKQVQPGAYATPRDYPMLKGRYQAQLDYEGQVARSCIHCHQIGEAERHVFRDQGQAIPDKVLFPYPDPSTIGLRLSPKGIAAVREVEKHSAAEKAGLTPGDEILTLGGQPLLSIADVQHVLHGAPAQGKLVAEVLRGEQTLSVMIPLEEGWRRGNLSWRPTSWDLRRMALGGMKLAPVSDEERRKRGLGPDDIGLVVQHVGQYGPHARAKQAGVLVGDILVGFGELTGARSETDLFRYALQVKRPGDEVRLTVLRNGEREEMRIQVQ